MVKTIDEVGAASFATTHPYARLGAAIVKQAVADAAKGSKSAARWLERDTICIMTLDLLNIDHGGVLRWLNDGRSLEGVNLGSLGNRRSAGDGDE